MSGSDKEKQQGREQESTVRVHTAAANRVVHGQRNSLYTVQPSADSVEIKPFVIVVLRVRVCSFFLRYVTLNFAFSFEFKRKKQAKFFHIFSPLFSVFETHKYTHTHGHSITDLSEGIRPTKHKQ